VGLGEIGFDEGWGFVSDLCRGAVGACLLMVLLRGVRAMSARRNPIRGRAPLVIRRALTVLGASLALSSISSPTARARPPLPSSKPGPGVVPPWLRAGGVPPPQPLAGARAADPVPIERHPAFPLGPGLSDQRVPSSREWEGAGDRSRSPGEREGVGPPRPAALPRSLPTGVRPVPLVPWPR
jgi:hypothetical protein